MGKEEKTHNALLFEIDELPEEIPIPTLPGKCIVCGRKHRNVGRYCGYVCRDKWIAKARLASMRYNGKVAP